MPEPAIIDSVYAFADGLSLVFDPDGRLLPEFSGRAARIRPDADGAVAPLRWFKAAVVDVADDRMLSRAAKILFAKGFDTIELAALFQRRESEIVDLLHADLELPAVAS
ncbi:hypothetical protein [Beijerinckia sp. L45]|uniref:hypothetical protein n=1 Tax=Beijerinckia sp. L45 TaxID=1641855 RepID=UPI00131E7157|nr:hypothetical protein [Beijerinckia sp. L45]